jgi:amino acid permease
MECLSPRFDAKERRVNISQSVFSLVATMIGGGVLSLPYAFKCAGLLGGSLMLVASAASTDIAIYLLISCSRRTGSSSFVGVARDAFGKPAELLTVYLLFMVTIMSTLGYLILARDNISDIVSWTIGAELESFGKNMVVFAIAATIFPLCLTRSLSGLGATCFVSFSSVCILALVLLVRSVQHNFANPDAIYDVKLWPASLMDGFFALPIISVSYLCVFNVLPTHGVLERPTRVRLKRMVHSSIVTTTFIYLLVGISGYLAAYEDTTDDITRNFALNDPLMLMGRGGLSVTLLFGLPFLVLPCRESLLEIIDHISGSNWSQKPEPILMAESFQCGTVDELQPLQNTRGEQHAYVAPSERLVTIVHVGSTVLILAFACCTAILAPGVSSVWSLMGSSVAMLLGFILPGAFYLSIRRKKSMSSRKVAACLLVLFGVVLGVICTACSLLHKSEKTEYGTDDD